MTDREVTDFKMGKLFQQVEDIATNVEAARQEGKDGRKALWDEIRDLRDGIEVQANEVSNLKGKATMFGILGGTTVTSFILWFKEYFKELFTR